MADNKMKVKYLLDEIEEQSEEIAKLKFKLRNTMTLFSSKPGERYKNLTPDQLLKVDDFVTGLK